MRKIFITIALLASCTCFSQANEKFISILQRLDTSLQSRSEKYPQERIALLTDKTQYVAGDHIWLSFLVTVDGSPTYVSKVMYVEVSDANGKLVDKKMLPVEKGLAYADVSINANWPSGVYYINAYTRWMLNFPELLVQKPVIIYNTDWIAKPIRIVTSETTPTQIHLFPEGGLLLPGEPQRAIIRAYSKNHLPVKTGFNLLEDGKLIASGETNEFGISEISLEPKTGKNYQVQTQHGDVRSTSLSPRSQGAVLSVNTTNNKRIFVQAKRTEENKPSYNKLLLVGLMNNKIVYNGIIDFEEGTTGAAIARNKLPAGVLELLLVDQYENVISAVKTYNPPASLPLVTHQQSGNISRISVLSADSSQVITQVSIQDTSGNALHRSNKLGLVPELHLEHSVWVRDLGDSNTARLVNQLLIQHTVLDNNRLSRHANPATLQHMVESGITIMGKVRQYGGRSALKSYEAELIILGEDSTTMLARAMTKEDGLFAVPDARFSKSAKVYFQAHNPSNKRELMDIKLEPGYFDALKSVTIKPRPSFVTVVVPVPSISQNDPLKLRLEQTRATDPRYKELQEVIVKAKKLSRTDSLKQEYLSPLFNDGNIFMLEPDGNYFNVWAFIRGRVPGLKVEGDINNPEVYFSRYAGVSGVSSQTDAAVDASLLAESTESIQFFLNEIPVSKDIISSLAIDDIALITSNREPMAGLGASFGVISVYTKKGVANTTSNQYKSMTLEKRSGFSVTRPFFYENEENDPPGKLVYHAILHGYTPKKMLIPVLKDKTYNITVVGWDKNGNMILEEKTIRN